MQCEEWDDANSELFKESHDEAVHKNSYKSRLYELISASLKRRKECGRLPASHRSFWGAGEESWRVPQMIHGLLHTGRREGVKLQR